RRREGQFVVFATERELAGEDALVQPHRHRVEFAPTRCAARGRYFASRLLRFLVCLIEEHHALRFWILDFGFWISRLKQQTISVISPFQNPKSKIQNG